MGYLGLEDGEQEHHCLVPELPNFINSACAGRVMALDTMWIAMASILAVFDISKAVDERGNEISPPVKLSPGTIR